MVPSTLSSARDWIVPATGLAMRSDQEGFGHSPPPGRGKALGRQSHAGRLASRPHTPQRGRTAPRGQGRERSPVQQSDRRTVTVHVPGQHLPLRDLRCQFRTTSPEEQHEINAQVAALIASPRRSIVQTAKIYLPTRLHSRHLNDFSQDVSLDLSQVSLPTFDAHLRPAARPQSFQDVWMCRAARKQVPRTLRRHRPLVGPLKDRPAAGRGGRLEQLAHEFRPGGHPEPLDAEDRIPRAAVRQLRRTNMLCTLNVVARLLTSSPSMSTACVPPPRTSKDRPPGTATAPG